MFERLSKLFKREIQKNETELDKYIEFWKSIFNTFPKQVIKKLHERRFNIETDPKSGRSYDFTFKDIFWWKELMRDNVVCLKPVEEHKREVKDFLLDILDEMNIDESDKETKDFIMSLVEEKLEKTNK